MQVLKRTLSWIYEVNYMMAPNLTDKFHADGKMPDESKTYALDRRESFRFKQFGICDAHCGMKLCSDSVLLGAWCFGRLAGYGGKLELYDIGAGSGILGLMCAQRFPGAGIVAVEIDEGAVYDAKGNIDASPWADRMELVHGDVTRLSFPAQKADGIVANPPYFTAGERSPQDNRAKARHSRSATSEGLRPGVLGTLARHLLKPGASLDVVYPYDMAEDVIFEMTLSGLDLSVRLDISHRCGSAPVRSLMSFVAGPSYPQTGRLSIRGSDGSFTDEFKKLTEMFYLKF